ncbi:helix-turn-helix domain-containing protein [Oceanobacillus bengalensis]|uniref:Helix-turn-helix domain-containing protein n=1 Tax=Oceanobacillus bengalensis TaxID=1435466 RepID=A0A494Z5N3_9BACI|nr:helix-turn-helix domain-containing protein [Oceanobacillus bengalensis]RKQ17311.1 helix-turn-helix domain-containing protein [Oceanobacillus bengalensis]
MDIGARLKEERVSKGLSLEELQEITKIQKRYLAAIEEGKLEILPGKFYARAFIKEYANAVGLDPSELLEEHKEEIPKTEEDSTVQYSRMQRTKKDSNLEKSSSFFSIFPTIIVVLLIIGIILVLWFFIKEDGSDNGSGTETDQKNTEVIINNPNDVASEDNDNTENNEDETGETTETEEPVEEEPEEEEGPQAEFVVVEEGTGSTPESTLELNNTGEEVIVLLESAEGNTWLDVTDADGKSFYSANFDENTSPHEIDMSDTDRIFFNVGNAPALKISINGVELEYPVDISNVHQRLWVNINNETE